MKPMKKQLWLSLMTLAAFALAGCGKSTDAVQATSGGGAIAGSDAAQVSAVVDNNPQYADEDVFSTDQVGTFDGAAGFAAVRPLRFWRQITNVERSRDIEFGTPDADGRPTMALVTLHRHLTGTFHLLAGSTDPADTSRTRISKPLDDQWTRRMLLQRVKLPNDSLRWRLVGTSGAEVKTQGGSTHLVSLRIQAGAVDTTITDPLAMHRLRRILFLPPATPVTLTATTGNADDAVLFYGRDARRRFMNNGDGTHTFQFPAPRFMGLGNFGVDVLSHGTLFDDTAAYDSNAWIFLFACDPGLAPVAGR